MEGDSVPLLRAAEPRGAFSPGSLRSAARRRAEHFFCFVDARASSFASRSPRDDARGIFFRACALEVDFGLAIDDAREYMHRSLET
jgi:hypothetical protein